MVSLSGINETQQVGDGIRNPRSQRLQDYVVKADNAGLLRRLNLGVVNIQLFSDLKFLVLFNY